MKNIHVIETFEGGLKLAKSYLADSQSHYSEFSAVRESLDSGDTPALIILLAKKDMADFNADIELLKYNASFARVPRIFVLPFEISEQIPNPEMVDGEPSFPLPVDKLRFLTTVSKCLNRSPRRVFRILVSVVPGGSNIRYSGVSLDFSETGMAFECDADLPKGQEVKVHFVNPKNRKRFLFNAMVVRRAFTRPGSTAFYGIQFREMTADETTDLMDFITGER